MLNLCKRKVPGIGSYAGLKSQTSCQFRQEPIFTPCTDCIGGQVSRQKDHTKSWQTHCDDCFSPPGRGLYGVLPEFYTEEREYQSI